MPPKANICSRINIELLSRLELVAKVDRRSLSQVVEMCIERGLPSLEGGPASTNPPADYIPTTLPAVELTPQEGRHLAAVTAQAADKLLRGRNTSKPGK